MNAKLGAREHKVQCNVPYYQDLTLLLPICLLFLVAAVTLLRVIKSGVRKPIFALCLSCFFIGLVYVVRAMFTSGLNYYSPEVKAWYVGETLTRLKRVVQIVDEAKQENGALPSDSNGLYFSAPWNERRVDPNVDIRRDADGNYFQYRVSGNEFRIYTNGCDQMPYTNDDIEYRSDNKSFTQNGRILQP
jgi:hypothetical protein